MIIISKNKEETLNIGKIIGESLVPGDIIALCGELGVGKTWLSRGIAYGAGVNQKEYVHSPAFDLIHEYSGKIMVYHMDFYRIETLTNDDYLWLEEYMNMDGICIIEWADKYINDFIIEPLLIRLSYEKNNINRKIEIFNFSEKYLNIKEALENAYPGL